MGLYYFDEAQLIFWALCNGTNNLNEIKKKILMLYARLINQMKRRQHNYRKIHFKFS